jgi:DNA gyrase subunit A
MEIGLVRSIDIDREMQQAYLDYAMSVIVARALPDARDGLKPVHRRILYAMYDMGMRPDTPYKKSARIVGEVLGKYHPHGDMAVYEAMARMAQPFSMRTLLVEGQGNFGSVDGDPPAAMRYTEARLALPAMNMLADIQKDTVDFNENFDGSLKEPDVLPAALPNLLVNGATGIAVGMSTSIPPHNLSEVVDALVFMLNQWESLEDINVEDLMQFIKGPDFPTGGIIVLAEGDEGLAGAYGSGRGRVAVQARAHFEEMSRGRNRIIVTELPYMTNKASLIERIAELVREERVDGIADLRDESDRQGLRVVIELNKTADPAAVLENLYKSTQMRSTFGIIMLALVDGEPRTLGLKQALRVYLEHRLDVVRRKSEFDLEKAKQRAHILEGLRIALKYLDEVISLIRKAPDAETARVRLIKKYKLSEIQAQAILDMQLRRLAALERKKIEDEYKDVKALIKDLQTLLRSPKKMRQVVAEELLAVKDAFGDRRRTQIIKRNGNGQAAFQVSDMTSSPAVWVSVTEDGLISRSLEDALPTGGKASPRWLVRVNSRDTLYLVSQQGDAAGVPLHALPETSDPMDGAPVYRVSALGERDNLAALFTLPPKEERPEGWYVFSGTRGGNVKKTAVTELPGATARTFSLMKVNEGDSFGWAFLTNGKADLLLVTGRGQAIRFSEDEVRPMGLGAAGVSGIKLQVGDEVAGLDIVHPGGELLMVSSGGKIKRVAEKLFPKQGRYGQGVVAWKMTPSARIIGSASLQPTAKPARMTLHLNRLAPKQLRPEDAPLQTRAASGKILISLKGSDSVVELTTAINLGDLPPFGPGSAGDGKKGRKTTDSPSRRRSKAPASKAPEVKSPVKAVRRAQAAEKEPVQLTFDTQGLSDQKASTTRKTRSARKTKDGPVKEPETRKTGARSAAEKPAAKKAAGTKKAAAKTVAAKPAAKKAAGTKKAAAKTVAAKPAAEKPAAKKAAGTKKAAAKTAAAKTTVKKPVAKKAAAKKTGTKKAAASKTTAGKSDKAAAKKGSGKTAGGRASTKKTASVNKKTKKT